MKQSEKLEKEIKNQFFWWKKLYSCIWTAPAMATEEQDRAVRRQIETKLFEIKTLIREHYVPKIGKARVQELE